jgi:hypothetical protein
MYNCNAMVAVVDVIHCERQAIFDSFEEAIAELRRRAAIPHDGEPNRAPCTSWRTCGREYHILEYGDATTPWTLLRAVAVLTISADGPEWADGYEQAWRDAASG